MPFPDQMPSRDPLPLRVWCALAVVVLVVLILVM